MKIECVVRSRDALGEGVLWNGDERRLYWVDALAGKIQRWDPATGAVVRRERQIGRCTADADLAAGVDACLANRQIVTAPGPDMDHAVRRARTVQ